MKKCIKCSCIIVVLIGTLVLFSSCYTIMERKYYADKSNYVNATGVVDFLNYSENPARLYVSFNDLEPNVFSTSGFKLVGENAELVLERGIKEKLKLGDRVEFISAPEYFGDGYVMPIVSITVNGEELLSFEEGYAGLMKYLN